MICSRLYLLSILYVVLVDSDACECDTAPLRYGLQLLYNSTNGPQWKRSTNWLSSSPVCNWYGIDCYAGALDVDLEANELVGTLPPELGELFSSNISIFSIEYNHVYGTLPHEYALWRSIQIVVLGHNELTGTLPVTLASWTRLRRFDIDGNSFSGTFPDEFCAWSNLIEIDLEGNRFEGTFPEAALLAWASIELLDIKDNTFTGTIPEGLMWSRMREFAVGNNSFTGSLPLSDMKRWDTLRTFDVQQNYFSGALLEELGGVWPLLRFFSAGANNFTTGTLPSFLAQWTNLLAFDVSSGTLTGTLPRAFDSWRFLCTFDVSGNALLGTLPPEYAVWECAQFQIHTRFSVASNAFSGTLPPEYGQWHHEIVDFSNNSFTGTLPIEYRGWGSGLLMFNSGRNKLTGSLPPAYGEAWTSLTLCSVMHNQLSGPIPSTFGKMPSLQVLLLNNNMFTGVVPVFRVSFYLLLHGNRGLSGSLPRDAPPTFVVSVCDTNLCGVLPPAWTFATVVCETLFDRIEDVSAFSMSHLVSVPSKLPPCGGSRPPAGANSTTSPLLTPEPSLARIAAQSLFATAAVSISGSSSSLQVSLRAAAFAKRIAACQVPSTGNDVESPEIGSNVADSPTRLSLPSRLPLTFGTLIGNTLLMLLVPACVAGAVFASTTFSSSVKRLGSTGPLVLRAAIASLLGVWNTLQVPTTAAAFVLALDAKTSTVNGVAGALGLIASVAPFLLFLMCWRRARFVDGRITTTRSTRCHKSLLVRIWTLAIRPRSIWRVDRRPHARAFCVESMMSALTINILNEICYPYRWVIVVDQTITLLQGLLVGLASCADAPCLVLIPAVWLLAAVCLLPAVVAVWIRPRNTNADCLFQIVMCTWTLGVAIATALAGEDDAAVVAQVALQLIWGLPFFVWRCRRIVMQVYVARRQTSRSSSAASRSERLCSTVQQRKGKMMLLPFVNKRGDPQLKLRQLLMCICERGQ